MTAEVKHEIGNPLPMHDIKQEEADFSAGEEFVAIKEEFDDDVPDRNGDEQDHFTTHPIGDVNNGDTLSNASDETASAMSLLGQLQEVTWTRPDKDTKAPLEIFKCPLCDYSTITLKYYRRHLRQHAAKSLKCPYCAYESKIKYHMGRHIKSHLGAGMTVCTYCPFQTTRSDVLKSHMLMHEKQVPSMYSCTKCCFTSSKKEELRFHTRSHFKFEKIYSCPECSYSTVRRGHFNRHINNHNKKVLQCPCCEYSTNKPGVMFKHIEHHRQLGQEIYVCADCHYMTVSDVTYARHLKTHKYNCPLCSYTALREDYLLKHMQMHEKVQKSKAVYSAGEVGNDNEAEDLDDASASASDKFLAISRSKEASDNVVIRLKTFKRSRPDDDSNPTDDLPSSEVPQPEVDDTLTQAPMGRNAPRKSKSKFRMKLQSMFPFLLRNSDPSTRAAGKAPPALPLPVSEINADEEVEEEEKGEDLGSWPSRKKPKLEKKKRKSSFSVVTPQDLNGTVDNGNVDGIADDGSVEESNVNDSTAEKELSPVGGVSKAAYCSNGRIGSFSCLLCNFTTTTRKYLNRHLRRHGNAEKLTCPTCNYACTSAVKMKKHLEGHVGLHSCLLCPYATVHKEDLALHMAEHRGNTEKGSALSLELVPSGTGRAASPQPHEEGFDSDASEPALVTISRVPGPQETGGPTVTEGLPSPTVEPPISECNTEPPNEGGGVNGALALKDESLNSLITPGLASLVQLFLNNSQPQGVKPEAPADIPPETDVSQLPLYVQLSVLANMSTLKSTSSPQGSGTVVEGTDATEESVYSCTQCTYSTNRKDHLLRHHNQHTGKGMQYCPHCPYSTVRKEHMKRHVKLHTEGVLRCDRCDFKTRRKEQFRLHMQSHEAGDPLKCPHCSYITLRKEHLKRHLHRHTLDRPAECRYCRYTTDRRDRMVKHVENLHNHIGGVEEVFRYLVPEPGLQEEDSVTEDTELQPAAAADLAVGPLRDFSCAETDPPDEAIPDDKVPNGRTPEGGTLDEGLPEEITPEGEVSGERIPEGGIPPDESSSNGGAPPDEGTPDGGIQPDGETLPNGGTPPDEVLIDSTHPAGEDSDEDDYCALNFVATCMEEPPEDMEVPPLGVDSHPHPSDGDEEDEEEEEEDEEEEEEEEELKAVPSYPSLEVAQRLAKAKADKLLLGEQQNLVLEKIRQLLQTTGQQQQLLVLQQILQVNQLEQQQVDLQLQQLEQQFSAGSPPSRAPPPLQKASPGPRGPHTFPCPHCPHVAHWNAALQRHLRECHAQEDAEVPVKVTPHPNAIERNGPEKSFSQKGLSPHQVKTPHRTATPRRGGGMLCNHCSYLTYRPYHMKRHIQRVHKHADVSEFTKVDDGDTPKWGGHPTGGGTKGDPLGDGARIPAPQKHKRNELSEFKSSCNPPLEDGSPVGTASPQLGSATPDPPSPRVGDMSRIFSVLIEEGRDAPPSESELWGPTKGPVQASLRTGADKNGRRDLRQKDISCTFCSYRTSRMDHMRTHLARHTGVGCVSCPTCPYRTGRRDHLQRHLASCKGGASSCRGSTPATPKSGNIASFNSEKPLSSKLSGSSLNLKGPSTPFKLDGSLDLKGLSSLKLDSPSLNLKGSSLKLESPLNSEESSTLKLNGPPLDLESSSTLKSEDPPLNLEHSSSFKSENPSIKFENPLPPHTPSPP